MEESGQYTDGPSLQCLSGRPALSMVPGKDDLNLTKLGYPAGLVDSLDEGYPVGKVEDPKGSFWVNVAQLSVR